jgi:hypothetical protein
MGRQTVRRYDQAGRLTRSSNVAGWFLLSLLGIASAVFAPSQDRWAVRVVGVAVVVIGGFFTVRLLRWQTIDVTPRRVVLRGLLRTTKLAVADIDRFVVVAPSETPSSKAKALAVRTRDGKTIELDDFSGQGSDAGSIEVLVERLNRDVWESSREIAGAA